MELRRKKVKTRPYSILIQKSKGSSAFVKQKVKSIAIEYRLQSIFPSPAYWYVLVLDLVYYFFNLVYVALRNLATLLTPTNNSLAVLVLVIYPPVIRCGLILTSSERFVVPISAILLNERGCKCRVYKYWIPVGSLLRVTSSISPQVQLGLVRIRFGSG